MPSPRFLLNHLAHFIALGFGSGLSKRAPGTMGTLWAWLSFAVLSLWLDPFAMTILMVLALARGLVGGNGHGAAHASCRPIGHRHR